MKFEITATPREQHGTGVARRMRRDGSVPGVVYGGSKEVAAIQLDHNGIYHQLKQEAFHASILTLEVSGTKEQVLLRDVQMHPFKPMVLHVDFQRVSETEKIHMKIPLHFINADIAPGVKLSGGIVSHIMNEVEVKCLAKDLPEYFEVDLSHLETGHSVHLSDLKIPENVELLELQHGDLPIATVVIPRGHVEEAAAAVAEVAPEAEAAAAVAASVAAPAKAPPTSKS